jgi:hypothetical protein
LGTASTEYHPTEANHSTPGSCKEITTIKRHLLLP